MYNLAASDQPLRSRRVYRFYLIDFKEFSIILSKELKEMKLIKITRKDDGDMTVASSRSELLEKTGLS